MCFNFSPVGDTVGKVNSKNVQKMAEIKIMLMK